MPKPKLKAVSLYMPHWPTDLILRHRHARRSDGRPDRPPVLLYVETAGRQLVSCRCEQAAAAGVRAGLTVAHARALLPAGDAIIRLQQPARDQAALKALAQWALRFSPIVASDPPDGLRLDVAGCERLFGGERRLLGLIADAVERLGFRTRVAMAPTFACAWAVTRFGAAGRTIVREGDLRRVLADLPVAALRLEQDVVEALSEVGRGGNARLYALERVPRSLGAMLLAGTASTLLLSSVADFFHFERVEGAYLGAGWTWRDLSPDLILRAKTGYAFGSEEWQVRLGAQYRLSERRRLWIGGTYSDQVASRPTIVSRGYNPTYLALFTNLDPLNYYYERGFTLSLIPRLVDFTPFRL